MESSDDIFETSCEDEIAVLREIFPDQVQDLRSSKHNSDGNYIPPKLTIKLWPQESRAITSSDYGIKLIIELNRFYPKSEPENLNISGINGFRINDQKRQKLINVLIELSREKLKQEQVYLYDLCVFTQENLHRNVLHSSMYCYYIY